MIEFLCALPFIVMFPEIVAVPAAISKTQSLLLLLVLLIVTDAAVKLPSTYILFTLFPVVGAEMEAEFTTVNDLPDGMVINVFPLPPLSVNDRQIALDKSTLHELSKPIMASTDEVGTPLLQFEALLQSPLLAVNVVV